MLCLKSLLPGMGENLKKSVCHFVILNNSCLVRKVLCLVTHKRLVIGLAFFFHRGIEYKSLFFKTP